MAEKTKEQANAVSEAVVSSVNTVATKTVEEVAEHRSHLWSGAQGEIQSP